MQLNSIYLYPNRLVVYTNIDAWLTERYRMVYNRNLKMYRGIDNKIEFRVKNSDQKPQDITGREFVIKIISQEDQSLVYKTDCTIDDAEKGKISFVVPRQILDEIEEGFYEYSLTYETREFINSNEYTVLSSGPAYIDSQYGVMAILEVVGSVDGKILPSISITEFSKYVEPWHEENYFLSSIIYAQSQTVTSKSNHTFQFFFKNYTGRITVQGSLDEGSSPKNWTDVKTVEYIGADREYLNIIGKFNWFRIKNLPYEPALTGNFEVNLTIFGHYDVSVINGGKNYKIGNEILIKGSRLGGESVTHDLMITVTGVDPNGAITNITWKGLSFNGVTSYTIGFDPALGSGIFDKILYR